MEKIKVKEAYEILGTTQFQAELKRQLALEINKLKILPPANTRWKASPVFSVQKKGLLDDEELFYSEYVSILHKRSALSSGERSYIQQIGHLAFKNISLLFEVLS